MAGQKIRIVLRAFDHRVLDLSARQITLLSRDYLTTPPHTVRSLGKLLPVLKTSHHARRRPTKRARDGLAQDTRG